MNKFLLLCALLLSGLGLSMPTRAAECSEITVPGTTILAGGHYCLGADLVSDITIVQINADHVDLDCRGYSIRSTNAVPNQNTYGVYFANRKDVHVHGCHISGGFAAGIYAYQDNGVANQNQNLSFADNTISGTYWFGILAYGTDIDIRDNRIHDIGGRASFAMGIRVGGSTLAGEPRMHVVRGNVVSNVVSPVNYGYGIYSNSSNDSAFVDNTVTGSLGADTWFGFGIKLANGTRNRVADNHIVGVADGYSIAIQTLAGNACFHNYLRADNLALGCDSSLGNY